MDKMKTYQKTIKEVLGNYSQINQNSNDPVKTHFVADDLHGQYLLIDSGWQGDDRFYSNYLHISLLNNKLRIERDLTDYDFVNEFLEKGISKEDIVLEFQAPSKRKYSGFAVN
jgi:hypothetical protein